MCVLNIRNSTQQVLVYPDDVNMLGAGIHIMKKNTETLIVVCKEVGLEENTEDCKYMVMP